MMNLREIQKPTTLAQALDLLQQPDTVALAGGTELIASRRSDVRRVVDLSALGLSYIREDAGAVTIGATTPLADLAESPILRAAARGLLAQAAHRSAGSILRNQETIGGTLIAEPDSLLATALLALDAQVTIVRKEPMNVPAADFLSMREHLLMMALMTQVAFPLANPRASLQIVGRTPRDRPIVAVCAAARFDGDSAHGVRIALSGVGETAVRARAAEALLEGQAESEPQIEAAARVAAQGLEPRGDFRGSVEYRKEMAVVLTGRAVRELFQP
ncbi:MAG: FAD binding domain-containing protein [Chloroflexi bacterium]|nr:FAD binding domain-containing protein [Chloroflexota bacterium]